MPVAKPPKPKANAKKRNGYLYDPQLVTGHGARKGFAGLGRVFGNDPSNFIPPWPLWNDWYINETVWDLTVNELKMRSAAFTASLEFKKSAGKAELEEIDPESVKLVDNTGRAIMPTEMEVAEWKRPRELTNEKADDYYKLNLEPGDLDLEVNNKHLFRYKSMRHIISTVCCLERASGMYPYFPAEFLTSTDYVPNTGPDWHPWQHVYAMTKVGAGSQHTPKYNPYGMYFVRLFFMGAWRKVTVDDFIPINSKGEWLLPRSKDPGNLWMPLLTKALLKVASMSRMENNQFYDFNVIRTLTGYICISLSCRNVEPDKLWRILESHLKPSKDALEEDTEEESEEKVPAKKKPPKGKKTAPKKPKTPANKKKKKKAKNIANSELYNDDDEGDKLLTQLNCEKSADEDRGGILKLEKSFEELVDEYIPNIVVCEMIDPVELTELPNAEELSVATLSEGVITPKGVEVSDLFTVSKSSDISEPLSEASQPESIGYEEKTKVQKLAAGAPQAKSDSSASQKVVKNVSKISITAVEENVDKSDLKPVPGGMYTNVDDFNKHLAKVKLEKIQFGMETEQVFDERLFESAPRNIRVKPKSEKVPEKVSKGVKEKQEKSAKIEKDKSNKKAQKIKGEKPKQQKKVKKGNLKSKVADNISSYTIKASRESSLGKYSTEDSDLEDSEKTLERRKLLEEGAVSEGEVESLRFCVATDSLTCINDNNEACSADPGSTIVLLYFHDSKKNEDINLPLTYEAAAYVYKLIPRRIPYYLPAWKMLRWAQFAYDFNIIRDMPGSVKREIVMYIPLKRRVEEYNELEPGSRKPLPILPTILDFDRIVKGICIAIGIHCSRRMDIYYRPSYFRHASYSIDLTGQPLSNDWSPNPINLGAIRTDPDAFKKARSYPNQCFYLCSDSLYCKNIFITLSVFNPRKVLPAGYLLCEHFSWSNPDQGKPLFSLRTAATKTHRLDLGPGLQACRFFFKMVFPYYVQINSDTPFMVGNKEFVQQYCLPETKSYQVIGEEMADRFSLLIAAAYNSEGLHGYTLERFKSCFLPWCLRRYSCPANDMIQGRILFDGVLEDKVMKMIFQNIEDSEIAITIMRFRILFLDDQFGDQFLHQYGQFVGDIRRHVDLLQKCGLKEELLYVNPKSIYRPNAVRKLYEGFNKKKLKPKRRLKRKLADGEQGKQEIDPNWMFHRPENCIKLLKSILEFDKAIANMYPCKRDTITNNVYRDYKGITDIIPTIKWAVIARFHFNVHSMVPVPCSFGLTCNLTRVVLVVYDLDAEELIYSNYDPNYTFYLAANKSGYVVVAHGHIDSQTTKIKNNQIPWRLRILGKSKEDLPHNCTLLRTGKCDHNEERNYNLNIDVVSEYYLPNHKNFIGRFIIEIEETTLVTLLVKLSYDKVNFLVTLTGEDDEILAEVSGVGQVMLPAVLLLQSLGIKNQESSSFSFYGSMTLLYHSWPLSTEEQKFVEELQTNEGAKPSLDLTEPDVKIFGAYWCISMIYDEMEEPPIIFPDRSLMDKFYVGLKLSVEEDPERVMRGRILREEYLKEFVGVLNEQILDEYNLLPSKENSKITEILLQKYANEDEHLFPCIFNETTQEKLREALAEGRERLSGKDSLIENKEVSPLNFLMTKQKEINEEMDNAISNFRNSINAKMKASYEDRDTFIHEQVEVAKRMAAFAEEKMKLLKMEEEEEKKKEKQVKSRKTTAKKKKK